MVLYLVLLRVIPGVKVHLVRDWPMVIKLRGSRLMDRFVGEVGSGRRGSRRLCGARRRSRFIPNCWTRCIRFLMCWMWRSVECGSCWSLGPWWSSWTIIILRIEVKQPTNMVIWLCLGIIIFKSNYIYVGACPRCRGLWPWPPRRRRTSSVHTHIGYPGTSNGWGQL